ncbi:MAG: galactonate dehydratase [Oscillospiraceae bacterium]|nr:galactonate dehydratase [Oscillospiraceae bacterium]
MKITKLECMYVKPYWNFLKVHTDEGITGYGEPLVEGRAKTVAMAVEELGDYIIGKDPRDVERLWQSMYKGSFYRGGPVLASAVSGVEQALWDITGKFYGLPVYKLLGGAVRDRIRMYAWIRGDTGAELAASAKEHVKNGFNAVKMAGAYGPLRIVDTPEKIMELADRVGAVREAVGMGVDIGVDFHGRFTPAMAKLLIHEIEQYHPMFVEEPCLMENVDCMADIAHSTHIPIATGERLFTRWGFREVLEKRAAAILQPDVCHAGGIFELKKIAAMGEAYYCGLAPHNPMGPIALAASIQVDACTPNFFIQEHTTLGEGLITEPFVQKGGYVEVPQKPGLGVEIDEEAIKDKIYDGSGHLATWNNADDGSFAEW